MFDLFRRKFMFVSRVAALLCLIGICVLSLCPGGDVPMEHVSDKLRHGFAYGTFCVLVGCALFNLRWWSIPFAFAIVVTIGGGMEMLQPYFGRDRDVWDEVANATGASVGCVILIAVAMVYFRATPRAQAIE